MAAPEIGTKNMTLRLERSLAEKVQATAEVEAQSVANVVRDAIAEHVELRRSDPPLSIPSRRDHEATCKVAQDAR